MKNYRVSEITKFLRGTVSKESDIYEDISAIILRVKALAVESHKRNVSVDQYVKVIQELSETRLNFMDSHAIICD